jgi:hypothetical protein
MDAKLTKLLELISVRAEEISRLSDGVNARIEEVEDALTRVNVGISLPESVLIEAEDAEWLIGYRKFDKDWGISIAKRRDDDRAETAIRLLKAPRVVRLAALGGLGLLLRGIKDRQDLILMGLREIA